MKKIKHDQRETKEERAKELATAECELSRLADFFDMERKLNAAMDAGRCQYDFGQHEYESRDDAYDDWFSHQLSTEEAGCAAAACDAVTLLAHMEATLSNWIVESEAGGGPKKFYRVKQIVEHLALPGEMRLIKLFRLAACKERVRSLRAGDETP